MRKIVIMAVIGLLLAGFTWSAAQQESLLTNGREVLVALTPVDPRALLMGDYMALDFVLNRDVSRALAEKYGEADRREGRWFAHYERSVWPSQGLAIVRLTGGTEHPAEQPSVFLTEIATTQSEQDEMDDVFIPVESPNAASSPTGTPVPAGTLVFVRLDDGSPLAAGEHVLLYRVQGHRVNVAAPAFYFQEGDARVYENARYGVLRLGADGQHLLVHLADAAGKPIKPARKTK